MSVGLIALLDDVAAMAKLAAASIDDVSAAAAKASAKAAGVVIDDAAVTPRYVTGLRPERELPIIGRIALGSLRNKLLFLLPAALALSAFAPWALTPLLMLGGAYLCFEGAEKVIEKIWPHQAHATPEAAPPADPAHIEQATIAGAIRTDLILSSEIMAIALATLAAETLWEQAIILVVVSLVITAGVYGVVALIVKMDDIGLHLVAEGGAVGQSIGGALVRGMPVILTALTGIGTAAMLWVGGGIIVHGLEELGVGFLGHEIEGVAHRVAEAAGPIGGALGWLVGAAMAAVVGIGIGGIIALAAAKLSTAGGKKNSAH
tara:strand:- start:93621 stop:94577 length:957 start_codon:yes stop_codon:yes gene_type:complete